MGFNRYIVECKAQIKVDSINKIIQDLIDTLWNVKAYITCSPYAANSGI